jgi:hypothetical protein
MSADAASEITEVLRSIRRGDGRASGKSLPLVYDELRRLAALRMAQEQPGQTLQATAIAHEAWRGLVADGEWRWQNQLIGSSTNVSLSASVSGGNVVIRWPTTSALDTLLSSPLLGAAPCGRK